jgi:hypothetical protein
MRRDRTPAGTLKVHSEWHDASHCAMERARGGPGSLRLPLRQSRCAAAGRRGGSGLAYGGVRVRRPPLEEEAVDLCSRVIEARAVASAVAVEEGGGAAVVVVGLRVRAGGEKEAHGSGVAVVGGVQEGGPAGVVTRVHGSGVCAEVAAEDLIVPIRGRLIQIGKVLRRRSGMTRLAAAAAALLRLRF